LNSIKFKTPGQIFAGRHGHAGWMPPVMVMDDKNDRSKYCKYKYQNEHWLARNKEI
jgi:hypothetical protein